MHAPDFTQSFNRYSYVWNNPLRYTDPDGEFVVFAAIAIWLTSTESGYETQKYISPFAFRIEWGTGTHEKKLGFEVSVGVPKTLPYSKRWHYGSTYYWDHISGISDTSNGQNETFTGWGKKKGWEKSYFGQFHHGENTYIEGEFTQTVGFYKFGFPSMAGFEVHNDLFGDGGDRYRTSFVRLNMGPMSLSNIMFTGDPGLESDNRMIDKFGRIIPMRTYVRNIDTPNSPDPDAYRSGVLALRVGPFSIGQDSEVTRYTIQNLLIHTPIGSPFFRYIRGRKNKFYFNFGL